MNAGDLEPFVARLDAALARVDEPAQSEIRAALAALLAAMLPAPEPGAPRRPEDPGPAVRRIEGVINQVIDRVAPRRRG